MPKSELYTAIDGISHMLSSQPHPIRERQRLPVPHISSIPTHPWQSSRKSYMRRISRETISPITPVALPVSSSTSMSIFSAPSSLALVLRIVCDTAPWISSHIKEASGVRDNNARSFGSAAAVVNATQNAGPGGHGDHAALQRWERWDWRRLAAGVEEDFFEGTGNSRRIKKRRRKKKKPVASPR